MLSSVTSNHETLTFPTEVEGFGYRFDENGELRHIETNERFEFEVTPGNQYYNQCHYEALGEIIGEYIEEELVKKYQFKKQIIPIEAIEDETIPKSRIYLSENVADCQILLFLIQGGGVLGSMFPYIERAKQLNWGIIIFNPNEHFGSYKDGDERKFGKIPGSESHQSHCIYVWENIVRNMTAKHILIVGHSYGGISVNAMLDDCKDFKSRVCAIALTDSVHSYGMIPSSSKKWFKNHTINWIKSSLPTNEPVNNNANQVFGCECRSAGHRKHEYTSGTAIEPIFEYLKDSLHKQKLQQEAKAENKGNEEEKEEDKENLEQKNNLIDDNKMEVEAEKDEKGNIVDNQAVITTTKIEEVKVLIDDDNNKVDYNKIEHTNIEGGDIDDDDNNVNVENDKKIDDVDKNVIVENSKKIDDVDKNVVAEKIEDDDSRKN
ncbi:7296_t:CDS:10 [Entrophospora sp. SA101]|nr:7296_t:CDS:10 [Entrophospora sp. SA101]